MVWTEVADGEGGINCAKWLQFGIHVHIARDPSHVSSVLRVAGHQTISYLCL